MGLWPCRVHSGGGLRNHQGLSSESRFHLAALTKPFAAVIILKLAEEGLSHRDDQVSAYGLALDNSPDLTIHHLLSHSTEGEPGAGFRYNGNRYAMLKQVMEAFSGHIFCALPRERILERFRSLMAMGYAPYGQTERSEPFFSDPLPGWSQRFTT